MFYLVNTTYRMTDQYWKTFLVESRGTFNTFANRRAYEGILKIFKPIFDQIKDR
jgi:hypothetical protein